jgi:hypothetical protein
VGSGVGEGGRYYRIVNSTRVLLDLYLTGNCYPRAIAGRYSPCASAGNAGLTLEALVSMVVQDPLNGFHTSSV